MKRGLPVGSVGKKFACKCRRCSRHGFNLQVRKIPWIRKWQPAPVLLTEKSHAQRSWWATVHRVTKTWTQLND